MSNVIPFPEKNRRPPPRKLKGGSPNVAVAYVRVSKEEQDLGPDAQRAAISAYAVARGITVVSWHEDRVTSVAEMEDRTGFTAALLSIVEQKAGLLLVAKRDRLARDVLLAAMIDREVARCGAKVEAADGAGNGDSPNDRFMRTVMDAFAELERAMIRSRTKSALSVKRARGERVGGIPFGMALGPGGKTLVPNEAEMATLARARQLVADGRSLQKTAVILANEGRLSRKGTPFHPQSLWKILGRSPG